MTGTDMAIRQKGRTVADFSADFEVEDVIPVTRSRDKDPTRGTSPSLPRWHKQPKSNASISSGGSLSKQPIADLDPHRLGQRQKQIDYGKNTLGYQRYLKEVPKNKRRRKGDQWLDPTTPDINQNISKRCFDGQIKVWRRALHKYDIQPEEDELQIRPLAFAERARLAAQLDLHEDAAVLSAAPSSPTNSSRSRGSLDGYMAPHVSDGGRKRCFQRAFNHAANGNPHPSKLLTSPAGPKPAAPQSAPPATAAETEPAPISVGRCVDPPSMLGGRGGLLPRGSASLTTGLPKAPQTAPPAAVARVLVSSTVEPPEGRHGGTAGEDLFREWDDDDYCGLHPLEDEELELVEL